MVETVVDPAILLDEAAGLWGTTKRGYRDGLIAVGRKLHQYLVARLRAGDAVNEAARRALKATRQHATRDAARRLGVGITRINELIRAATAADLLAPEEGLGSLSYSTVRAMRVMIYRPAKGRPISRAPGDGLTLPSASEEWAVRPVWVTRGPELVARAVREGWEERRLRAALRTKLQPPPVEPVAPPLQVSDDKYLTSGQIARMCRVNPHTVAKWVDTGELKGHVLPTSTHRRIRPTDLVGFLRRHDMVVPAGLQSDLVKVACGVDARSVPPGVTVIDDFVEFGAVVATTDVGVVLVGDDEGVSIAARMVRCAFRRRSCLAVLVLSEDSHAPDIEVPDGCRLVVARHPVDWFALAELREALGEVPGA